MFADPFKAVFEYVPVALNAVFGARNKGWKTEKLRDGKTLVKVIKQ